MIGIPIGWLAANLGEWLIHKHILHGLGRNKRSFWSFHWHDHHRAARRNGMIDEAYQKPFWKSVPRTKEVVALAGMAAAHVPLLPIAPFFAGTVLYRTWRYYQLHKRAHVDPQWAEEHLPWHVDHHMGVDQDANWCVTDPLFDELLGTRDRRRPVSTPTRAAA